MQLHNTYWCEPVAHNNNNSSSAAAAELQRPRGCHPARCRCRRVLRHGRSKANEAAIIVSTLVRSLCAGHMQARQTPPPRAAQASTPARHHTPARAQENGVKPEFGLAEAGQQQAAEAGRQLAAQLAALHVAPGDVVVWASPFSRTRETAAIAAAAAGLDPAAVRVRGRGRWQQARQGAVLRACCVAAALPADAPAAHRPPRHQHTPLLRERCFGRRLELTCHDNYCPAWWDARARVQPPAVPGSRARWLLRMSPL